MELVKNEPVSRNGVTYVTISHLAESGELSQMFNDICEKVRSRLPEPEMPSPDQRVVHIGSKIARDANNLFRYPPKDIPAILDAFKQAKLDRLEGTVWAGRAYNNTICEAVTEVLRERSGINYQVL